MRLPETWPMMVAAPTVEKIYHTPLLELIHHAHEVSLQNPLPLLKAKLLSVKTGACPEDCAYCAQSVHYKTRIEKHPLLPTQEVLNAARQAKAEGAQRFCLGGAYRQAPTGESFERLLEMVRGIRSLGLEPCCTLGMLTPEQARRLKQAGLHAYNHNLDTSENFYGKVVTTRTYAERLETLKILAQENIAICCGAIIGLGEAEQDRIDFIATLVSLPKAPESIPLNLLTPIAGTPLGEQKLGNAEKIALLRLIATCRIFFPKSSIRLAAGRNQLSLIEQLFCFFAGANSLFIGERLLTADNIAQESDTSLFRLLEKADVS